MKEGEKGREKIVEKRREESKVNEVKQKQD